MPFNFDAGLSAFGQGVAKVGSDLLQEQLKADNQRDLVTLADQLASKRDQIKQQFEAGQQTERLQAEAGLKEAQRKSIESETGIRARKEQRDVAAGQSISDYLDGGDDVLGRIKGSETAAGDRMTFNKKGSGAFGPYQIMPDTWADIRKNHPELNLPADMTKADEAQHDTAAKALKGDNAAMLDKLGIPVTPATLALAHRVGAGGTFTLLSKPDAQLKDLFPAKWLEQNPDMQGKTAQQFVDMVSGRMSGASMGADTMPTGLRRILKALAPSDAKGAAEIAFKWEEHRQTMEIAEKAKTTMQIGDGGVGYWLNPITHKAEPVTIDGQVLRFRDPEVAKQQTELIRTYTSQLTDISRAYMPQILSIEATIRKLQASQFLTDEQKKELESAKVEQKALRDRYAEERNPILSNLNRIGGQLLDKTNRGAGTPRPTGAPLPPLTDYLGQQQAAGEE